MMVIGVLAIVMGLAMVPSAQADTRNPLRDERWQTRPLVAVAPNNDHPGLETMLTRLRDEAAEVADRDMVVYVLTPTSLTRDGDHRGAGARDALIDALDAQPSARPEFVLVGKDGTVKMRGPLDTDLEAIFRRIDGMPMRRREMRESR